MYFPTWNEQAIVWRWIATEHSPDTTYKVSFHHNKCILIKAFCSYRLIMSNINFLSKFTKITMNFVSKLAMIAHQLRKLRSIKPEQYLAMTANVALDFQTARHKANNNYQ